jgi:hypothetical protein
VFDLLDQLSQTVRRFTARLFSSKAAKPIQLRMRVSSEEDRSIATKARSGADRNEGIGLQRVVRQFGRDHCRERRAEQNPSFIVAGTTNNAANASSITPSSGHTVRRQRRHPSTIFGPDNLAHRTMR